MKALYISLLLVSSLCIGACTEPISENTQIQWDEWGVPHIQAKNNEELFYSFGWAQMHSHMNLILELYAKSRGQAAEYWGSDFFNNDLMVHTLGFPEKAEAWQAKDELQKYFGEFVKGMNAYAEAHPEKISESNKVVLPVRDTDPYAHFLFVIYTRFIGGDALGTASYWENLGSNTYAVAPARSASGNSMLVANPHLPWFGEFLFYEAHLITPDNNAYGATLVGFPTLGIAFNENLGWSHTNNTIDNADLYELTLKEDGYILDGETHAIEQKQKNIKVKLDDGAIRDTTISLYSSKHGPIISRKKNKALALRMPPSEDTNPGLQWWKMSQAKNFEEFEAALKELSIPFFNIMYADKEGNIFYLFGGHVPKRSSGDWDFWERIVPGDRSELIWQDVHTYDELPKLKNPDQGWLQNANDPPWTSTIPTKLNPKNYPPYMAPVYMGFRPQRAARMMMDNDFISFDELVGYKHSTRMELADRLIDDLLAAAAKVYNPKVKEAVSVLETWDRSANADSKGAILFESWAQKFQPWRAENFTTPWQFKTAERSPDGLSDPEKALKLLEESADEVKATYGKLDIAWGDVVRLKYGQYDLPANGGDGWLGIFRVAGSQNAGDGKRNVVGGDSWVSVIEFGDEVKAKVLLSYGNSSDKNSPHYGDQLTLFSEQKLREAKFYPKQLEGHVKMTEELINGSFVEKDE